MEIMVKHVVKNLFAKPFRTFLICFCIAVCAFSALLCLDMRGSLEKIVRNMLTQVTGSADILMADELGLTQEKVTVSVSSQALLVSQRTDGRVSIPEGFVGYFHTDHFTVEAFDFETAYRMRLLPETLALSSDEAAVSSAFSQKFGLREGDSITLTSDGGEETEYLIKEVLPDQGMVNGQSTVILHPEGLKKLIFDETIVYDLAYIDVLDDEHVKEAAEELQKKDYRAEVTVILDDAELKTMMKMVTMMFLLMFAVCFLLVIFVTISVTGRVVNERISVVGTFRSLGLSKNRTTFFLLLESGFYGVIGGVFGCLLYKAVRGLLFSSLITVDTNMAVELDYGQTGFIAYLAVILGAVFVECICSIKEILKTSQMAIRDIIFDNKDTEYRFPRRQLLVGLFLLAMAAGGCVVGMFWVKSAPILLIGFVSGIVSAALLFPQILHGASLLFGRIFKRLKKPVARFASTEMYARKSTVGSSVLCVTSAALSLILFFFMTCLEAVYDLNAYDCDLKADTDNATKSAMYAYIGDLDGVKETEILYNVERNVMIGERKETVTVFGQPEGGFQLFTGIQGLPKQMEEGTFYMDKMLAEKAGIHVGEKVTCVFDADSFLPVSRTLTLAGTIDSYEYDTTSRSIVITKDLFIDIFHDYPGQILIRCEEPENVEKVRETITKISGQALSLVETIAEYKAGWQGKREGLTKILVLVIGLGVGLTVIGMISNQLIGFEGRKRECAVLASVAMDRSQIARVFLLESMLMSFTALCTAFPAAYLLFQPLKSLMTILMGELRVAYDAKAYAGFLILLWVVYSLVALFPVRALKKMKIAEQIRYE